jgi:hypothetical protein
MICYKDKTFCKSDCVNSTCYRFLSDAERLEAIKWWGSEDAPIAYSDFSKNCPDYKQNWS